MHSWSTFGAQINNGRTWTNKIHHGLSLGQAITFPLIIFSVPSHEAYIQMSFCPRTPKLGVSKFPKLGLLWLWRPITSGLDLWLRWGLKQSCNPYYELFNNVWHATCTKENQGDSQLLMVGSQIDKLTTNLSFGHNLCFKYPNGSCEPILDI
jgi:hypothetical protein